MEVMRMHNDINERNTITPADWVPGPQQGDWTYEAYAALTADGECYEIVQGVLVMSPSPEFVHQRFVTRLTMYLGQTVILNRLGEVITSPFDVVLASQEVYQPDIVVVLNKHLERVQKQCVMGAPDLVVEVMSPSSKLYDRVNKHMVYEKAGIPEYWLVNPRTQTVELFVLESGKYRSQGAFEGEQTLPSRIVPEMTTPVARFFE
jgi:Uma2 family endonuclease